MKNTCTPNDDINKRVDKSFQLLYFIFTGIGLLIFLSSLSFAQQPLTFESLEVQHVSAEGKDDGQIYIQIKGGVAPYEYQWELYKPARYDMQQSHARQVQFPVNTRLQPGVYYLQVKDAANQYVHARLELKELQEGTKVQQSLNVLKDPDLQSALKDECNLEIEIYDGPTTVCAGDLITLGGNPTAQGGVPPYEYRWTIQGESGLIADTDESNPEVIIEETTTYRLSVWDDTGDCFVLGESVSIETIDISQATAGEDQTICEGETAILEASGGNSYQWNTGETTASIEVSPATTTVYTVEISSACGDVTDDVTVNVIPQPNVEISTTDDTAYCEGEDIETFLEATPGFNTYQWYLDGAPITGATDPTYLATQTGIYHVEVTDDTCPGTSNSITISTHDTPDVVVYANGEELSEVETCEGDELELEAFSLHAVSYQWYEVNDGILIGEDSPLLYPTQDGQYYVETEDENGCLAVSETINIQFNPLPEVFNVTGGGVICEGEDGIEVGLDGSQTGVDYQLQLDGTDQGSPVAGTGSTLSFGEQNQEGVYTVTAINQDTGCTQDMDGDAEITIHPAPDVTIAAADDTDICEGESVELEAFSPDAVSYQWYEVNIGLLTGEDSFIFIATETGTYYAEATDSNGCTGTSDVIEVNVAPAPQVFNVTGGGSYCEGTTGVEVGLDGSQNDVNYHLYLDGTDTGDLVPGTGNGISFGLQTEEGIYTVVAINQVGASCSADMNGSAEVTVDPQPTAFEVTGGGTLCEGEAGHEIGLSGSETGISYQLQRDGTDIGAAVEGTGSPLNFGLFDQEGTYTVWATQSGTLCQGPMDGVAEIIVNPEPEVSVYITSDNHICEGGSVEMEAFALNAVSYQWYETTEGILVGETSPLFYATESGNYYAEVVDENGCTGISDPVEIVVHPLPEVFNVTGGGAFCEGEAGVEVGLDGSQTGVNYQLLLDGTDTGVSVEGTGGAISFGEQNQEGFYTVFANDPDTGCAQLMDGEAEIIINPLPEVTIAAAGDTEICEGESVELEAFTPDAVSYQWYEVSTGLLPGEDSFIYTASETGVYFAEATDSNGCTGVSDEIEVNVTPAPVAYNVTGGGSYCEGSDGVEVGLDGSQTDVDYFLLLDGSDTGISVSGTGSAISFGLQTAEGVYTVEAISQDGAACSALMNGSVEVTIDPLPTAFEVTGGGDICEGEEGVEVGLDGSETGVMYQLQINGSDTGSPLAGTGSPLSFGIQDQEGTYTVIATNETTLCESPMNGSAEIIIHPEPEVQVFVLGDNEICEGETVEFEAFALNAVSYQWYETTEGILVGETSPLFYATESGNYYAEVVDENGCTGTSEPVEIIVHPFPEVFNVTGGGEYCEGDTGVEVGLDGSETGVDYQLLVDDDPTGTPIAGTGEAISFGLQTVQGEYTVAAFEQDLGCQNMMDGSVQVTVQPLPMVFEVTGGGSFCEGEPGVEVGLSGSQTGVDYQLLLDGTHTGTTVEGTGSAISFGLQDESGEYTVLAIDQNLDCQTMMEGSAQIQEDPLPEVFNVTGGGTYCQGDEGLTAGLDGSQTNVAYQLFVDGAATGSPIEGTGSAIDFGLQTQEGTYTVSAIHTTTGCEAEMAGSAEIIIQPQPTAFNVTGGGEYCEGDEGLEVGLNGSQTGVEYQLLLDNEPTGSPVEGTGSLISFGLQQEEGIYTVIATHEEFGCEAIMDGNAEIIINPLPDVQVYVIGETTVCEGESVEMEAFALNAVSYQWFEESQGLLPGETSPIFYAHESGSYYVQVENTHGCIGYSDLVDVTVSPLPEVDISYDEDPYCAEGFAQVTIDGQISSSQSVTYTAGHIPTDPEFTSLPGESTCPGILTVNIPENSVITAVDVEYDMTSSGLASTTFMSQQRSQLRCTSPGGEDEEQIYQGVGETTGTYSYSRSGLEIANGVAGGGAIDFELHAGRLWPDFGGCATDRHRVVNETWTVTVHYAAEHLFTAEPEGLEIDPVTGEIDLGASEPGDYTVTYHFSDGICSNTTTTEVTVLPLPTAEISYEDSPYCAYEGNIAQVTFGPESVNDGTFSADSDDLAIDENSGDVDLGESEPGTYTVTYFFSDGVCDNTTTAEITIRPLPQASIVYEDSPYCAGEGEAFVTLDGVTGGSFESTDPEVVIDEDTGTVDLDLTPAGTYTIQYVFVDEDEICENITETTLVINPQPEVTLTYAQDVVCAEGSIAPLEASPEGGFFSTDPADGIVINNEGVINLDDSQPGDYTIFYTYTDGEGCTNEASFDITIHALPTAGIAYEDSPYCNTEGAFAQVTFDEGSIEDGTFSADDDLAIDEATGEVDLGASVPGTYTVTYTFEDENCENTTTTTITINPLPVVELEYADTEFCADGTTAPVLASPDGGDFSASGTLVIDDNGIIDLEASGEGDYTIYYTYTDENGCTNEASFDITINALPTADFFYEFSPYCAYEGDVADVTFGPGSPTDGTFSADEDLAIDENTGQVDLGESEPGTYTVTYFFSDGVCDNTTTAEITIRPLPQASIVYEDSPYCAGEGEALVTIDGVTGGVFESTSPEVVIDEDTGTIDLELTPAGTYTIQYVFVDEDEICENITETTLVINPQPEVTLTYPEDAVCATGSMAPETASPEGGFFSTDPADGIVINEEGVINLDDSQPGDYTIFYTYTDGEGCTNEASFDITIHALPTAGIAYEDSPYCNTEGAFAQVTFDEGSIEDGTFSADDDLVIDESTGEVDLGASMPGTYTVTYTFEDENCENITTTTITINPLPVVELEYADTEFCADGTTAPVLVSPDGGEFSASGTLVIDDNGIIDLEASGAGDYTIYYTYTDENGCTNEASFDITINALPTAEIFYDFSPYCAYEGDVADVTFGPGSPTDGTFSADEDLAIDENTGMVDLGASEPGTYIVTYFFSDGICNNTTSTEITIRPLPQASLYYEGAPYCESTGEAHVAFDFGPEDGVFAVIDAPASIDVGDVDIDEHTGTVQLDGLPEGTYTVIYIFADEDEICENYEEIQFVIQPSPELAIEAQDVLCAGESSGAITVSAISGQPPYLYELFDEEMNLLATLEADDNEPQTFEGLAAGSYFVILTDTQCPSPVSEAIIIDEPDPIVIDPASVELHHVSCFGDSDGQILLSANGGTGDLSYYLLSEGDTLAGPQMGMADFTELTAGLYNVAVSDELGCWVLSEDFEITEPDPVLVDAQVNPDIVCEGDQAAIEASAWQGIAPYTFTLWFEEEEVMGPIAGEEDEWIIFEGITDSGIYTVMAEDSNGCQTTTEVTVSEPQELTVYNLTTPGDGSYCENEEGVYLELHGSDTGILYQLLLAGEPQGEAVEGTGESIDFGIVSTEGIYTVVAIDPDTGCETLMAGDVKVLMLPLPEATIAYEEDPYCAEGVAEVTITGQEGGTFTADEGLIIDEDSGDVDLEASSTGTYEVTYVFTDGSCTNSTTTQITILAMPEASIDASATEICLGEQVTLTGSGGDTFSWTADPEYDFGDMENEPQVEMEPLETTTVFLTVTNECGESTAEITIEVNPAPVVDLGDDITACEGEEVILDAGEHDNVSYLWSDGSTGQTLVVTQPDLYWVEVTHNESLCSAYDEINVSFDPLPLALVADDQEICFGEEIHIGADPDDVDPIPANEYMWISVPDDPSLTDPTEANPLVSPEVTTTYTLIETYIESGCSNSNSVTITVIETEADAGEDQVICEGEPVTLGPEQAIEGVNYTWTSDNPEEDFENDVPNPVVTPDTTTTYTLVAEYIESGCIATAEVTITVNPLPMADAGADQDICLGDFVTLGVEYTEPMPPNTYQWISEPEDDSIDDPTISNPTVSPQVTTTYTLIETYTFTGCSNQNSVVVTVHDDPEIDIIEDTEVCEDQEIQLATANDEDAFDYTWTSEPTGFFSNEANPTVIPGFYDTDENNQITFMVEASNGFCTAQEQVVITILPSPELDIAEDMILCEPEEVSIGGAPVEGYTYLWSSSQDEEFSSTEANPAVTPEETTTYTVLVTDTQSGCTAEGQVIITLSDLTLVMADNPQICEGENRAFLGENIVVEGGSEPYQYIWTDAEGNNISNEINPVVNTPFAESYNLMVMDQDGCFINTSVVVEFIESPQVALYINNIMAGEYHDIYLGQTVRFEALPADYDLYEFYLIEPDSEDIPTDENGDEGEEGDETKNVMTEGTLVQSGSSNTYTTSDLVNGQKVYAVVYDRGCHGESQVITILVNELPNAFTPDGDGINDIFGEGAELTIFNRWGQKIYEGTQGWDGTFNGRKVSPGTYYYLRNMYDADNNKNTVKGSVTVILNEID